MPTSIEQIKENKVTELEHSAYYSNVEYISYLADSLKENTSIRSFFFDLCDMQDKSLEILHKSLLTRQYIEYIDLANNDLSDNSEIYIANLILHNSHTGMVIRISGSNKFSDDCKRRLESLAVQHGVKLVTVFPHRESTIDNTTGTLNLSNFAFDVRAAYLTVSQLKRNTGINRFLLNKSQLYDNDLAEFHEVLLQKKTITLVNLSNNLLSDKSIPFLIQLMSNNEGLELNVSGNKFSNEGIRQLIKAALIGKNIKLIATSDSLQPKKPFFNNKSRANSSHSDGDLPTGNRPSTATKVSDKGQSK